MEQIQYQMLHSNIIKAAVENVKILEEQLKIQKKEIQDMIIKHTQQQRQLEDEKTCMEEKQTVETRSLKKQVAHLQWELKEEKDMHSTKPRQFRFLTSENIKLKMENKKLDHTLLQYKRDSATVFGDMIEENPCYKFDDRELVTINEWIEKHEHLSLIPTLPFNLRRNELYF